ncbi:MAG: spore coat U domain-containing protein [Xanthomonadaceae bacterium]|nr:spore coat U domain-containing protein [Xanthomonadaceae bacterium]MDP2185431.1 spore coat U domain-containing protein [Xanthomonadales bacterium]MDZ4116221.1 spore coat U domain-containing protein [Xanthomonadaceae bacterium]MDZ4376999.1 spore coat U domain-containing protein [Xanthomonadaceae bacterium]
MNTQVVVARTGKVLFTAIASALLAGTAMAGPSPQTGSFQVTANVVRSCRVTNTTDIAFGNYDPADVNNTTALDASGDISVRCVKGTTANVAIEQGANPLAGSSCTSPLRQMAGGTEFLGYAIFQDAAHTTPWGCDTTNDRAFTASSVATPTTLTTYGRIPAGQDVSVGNFADTVNVTVTF